MTYAQLGDLRLATIYRLNFDENSKEKFEATDILDNGIHLDARCNDGQHWFAIAQITYDSDNDTYTLESIDSRFMENITIDNLEDAKYLINYAYKLMRKEWEKRHPDED